MRVRHFREKIVVIEEIDSVCREIRESNLTIVSSNGCFDILHLGHIEYLQSASGFGDILIIGINSDDSVRRLKGVGRPINSERNRASVIASLGFVDYCVIFRDDSPTKLLGRIRPDIHVKGGDYLKHNLPEKKVVEENGGIVKILPQVKGFSTTDIIKKS